MYGAYVTDWLLFWNVDFDLQVDLKSKGKILVYPIYKQNFAGFSAEIYILNRFKSFL